MSSSYNQFLTLLDNINRQLEQYQKFQRARKGSTPVPPTPPPSQARYNQAQLPPPPLKRSERETPNAAERGTSDAASPNDNSFDLLNETINNIVKGAGPVLKNVETVVKAMDIKIDENNRIAASYNDIRERQKQIYELLKQDKERGVQRDDYLVRQFQNAEQDRLALKAKASECTDRISQLQTALGVTERVVAEQKNLYEQEVARVGAALASKVTEYNNCVKAYQATKNDLEAAQSRLNEFIEGAPQDVVARQENELRTLRDEAANLKTQVRRLKEAEEQSTLRFIEAQAQQKLLNDRIKDQSVELRLQSSALSVMQQKESERQSRQADLKRQIQSTDIMIEDLERDTIRAQRMRSMDDAAAASNSDSIRRPLAIANAMEVADDELPSSSDLIRRPSAIADAMEVDDDELPSSSDLIRRLSATSMVDENENVLTQRRLVESQNEARSEAIRQTMYANDQEIFAEKLSEDLKAIKNNVSIFDSPARNTRSAKDKRQLQKKQITVMLQSNLKQYLQTTPEQALALTRAYDKYGGTDQQVFNNTRTLLSKIEALSEVLYRWLNQ